MPAAFRLTAGLLDSVPVLRLHGGMVFGERMQALHDAATRLTTEGHRRLILDLSAVEAADSTGVGAIVDVAQVAGSAGGRVYLLHLPDRVRNSLALIHVIPLFEIITDEAELCRRLAASGV